MDTSICTRPAKAADSRAVAVAVAKRRAIVRSALFVLCLLLFITTPGASQQTTVELVGGTQSLRGGYGDGGKFGSSRQWAATLSAATSAAHDEHRDLSGGIGLIRYFRSGLVIDGSVFWNLSNPGEVIARRQQVAVTYLRPFYSPRGITLSIFRQFGL